MDCCACAEVKSALGHTQMCCLLSQAAEYLLGGEANVCSERGQELAEVSGLTAQLLSQYSPK